MNLEPLAKLSDLQVLHLTGASPDLRPLASLRLVELACPLTRTTQGLDGLRRMASLQRLGGTPQAVKAVATFWREFDAAGR